MSQASFRRSKKRWLLSASEAVVIGRRPLHDRAQVLLVKLDLDSIMIYVLVMVL